MRRFFLLAMMAVFIAAAPVQGAVVRSGFDASSLAANDDLSTGLEAFGFTIDFFGQVYSGAYLNNNGNITFDAPLSTFTPFGLLATSTPIIAPFFADVDTSAYVDLGEGDLMRYGAGTVDGRDAFGVTWAGVGVGYFDHGVDKLNKFQVVLIDRSDTGVGNFDIEFNYDQIQWETGDASGGNFGLGGDSAVAGYSNGVDTAYELPGSHVNGAFLDSNPSTGLIHNTNVQINGRYVYAARNGSVNPPAVPEPAACVVWGLLALIMGGASLRRKRQA